MICEKFLFNGPKGFGNQKKKNQSQSQRENEAVQLQASNHLIALRLILSQCANIQALIKWGKK